jgi:hypothetical protein
VRVPQEAGKGKAKLTLSFNARKEGRVKPATFEVPVVDPEPTPAEKKCGHARARGYRGLSQLLAAERGKRNKAGPPRLTVGQILLWADRHFERTGGGPTVVRAGGRRAGGDLEGYQRLPLARLPRAAGGTRWPGCWRGVGVSAGGYGRLEAAGWIGHPHMAVRTGGDGWARPLGGGRNDRGRPLLSRMPPHSLAGG